MKKLVFCIIFLRYTLVFAQKEIILTHASNQVSVGVSCWAFKDSLHLFSENNFGNEAFEKNFQPIKKPSFGYTSATVWVKIKVNQTSNTRWFLELDNPTTNVVEYFLTQNNAIVSKQIAGDFNQFDSYTIKDRNPIFDLQFDGNRDLAKRTFVIYLKLKNTEDLSFNLTFLEEKHLISHLTQRNLLWGIFFGFILLIAIYNCFLWISIRDITYLFYVGYVLSFGLFQASLFGYGFQYLWGSSAFNEKAHILFVGLTVTFLALFSLYFLELFKFYPTYRFIFNKIGIIWAIIFPIIVLTFNESSNYFIVVITVLGIGLQIYFCFKLALIKSQNVRYYLLATLCLTLAVFMVILKSMGVLFTGDYYLKLGSMMEIVLFSLALGDKYRQEHIEKERQQRIRDEISTDLHDDLATSLSSLTMFSESNRLKAKKILSENEVIFSKVSEKTREILNLVRDSVWEMNPKNDSSDEWLDRMVKFATETLESKQIALDLNISDEIRTIVLPIDNRRDLFLFFKEAINNIAKYSDAKMAVIDIFMKHQQIYINISDNGKGFIISDLHKGNGLINFQKRADKLNGKFDIKSEINQGTRLKLNFKI